MAAGNPPPKPWERAEASFCPAPFKPPSGGRTCDVVQASGTSKHGENVYATGYGSSMYSCYGELMYSGGTGGSYGGYGTNPPPKPWERPGASYGPAPFKPPSAGSISDLVEALGTAEHGEIFSATWNSVVSNANSNIPRPDPPRLWQQRGYGNSYGGSNPPPKPWERAGASYNPAPFEPPSAGSTIDVVEDSGTAEHGGTVSGTWNSVAYNVNNITSRPVPLRLWQQRGYRKFYGRFSGPSGNNMYSDYGGGCGTAYGGSMYYNGGTGGTYDVYGMGMGPYNQGPILFGSPAPSPGFWVSDNTSNSWDLFHRVHPSEMPRS